MKTKLLVVLTVFICLVSGTVLSAVSGRITGVITSSETGDAVPGANVSVAGTSLGGISDANGKYTILNVPVGTYTIRISSVGFTTLEVSNVSVSVDLSSYQDHAVNPTTEELGDVIRVIAETPMVIRDKVASISIIKREELMALPTRGFEEVVGIQTGVVKIQGGGSNRRGSREATNAPELNIKGGRPSEVAYYVDGFSQQDPLSGTSTANISNNAIQEIKLISGGFPAEYGHVTSGVVEVTTISGSDEYHANVEIVTDNWGDGLKHTYDQNWYSIDLRGPVPGLEKGSFFASVERRYFGDRQPSAVTEDVLPGSPVRLPNNSLDGWSYMGKIDYDFAENLKFQLSGTGSRDEWRQYLHSYLFNSAHSPYYLDKNLGMNAKLTYTPNASTFYNLSGTYFVTERFRGDGVHRQDLWDYGRPGGNPANDPMNLFRAWDDPSTPVVYETRFVVTDTVTGAGDSMVFISSGDEGHLFDDYLKRKSSYIGFKGQVTSELNAEHTLKAGFEFNRHTLRRYQHLFPKDVYSGVDGGGFQDVNRYGYDLFGNESDDEDWQNETKHPLDIGFFLQDRLEFRGLILTAGLRFDYFDYKARRFRDVELPLNPDCLGCPDEIIDGVLVTYPPDDGTASSLDLSDTEASKKFTRLSPRLGIAFPVSDKTQMRLSYGHFYQRPVLDRLYVGYDFMGYKIRTGGYYVSFGSPNIEPPKTTAYEIGISQQLGENTAFEVNVFYKDVTDLIQVFNQASQPTSFASYRNSDYGTIKGLEFTLKTRRTRQIALDIKYTLSFATGTGSYSNTQGNVAWTNSETPRQTAPLTFDQRHKFVGVFDIRFQEEEGPRFGDFFPLANFGANIVLQAYSGTPYTPSQITNEATLGAFAPIALDTRNSETGPWTLVADLKFERSFDVGNFTIAPYFWIKNLLDRDNAVQVWEGTGLPNSTGYLETPAGQDFIAFFGANHDASGLTGEEKYQLAQNTPRNYGNPRQIFFGLRASF